MKVPVFMKVEGKWQSSVQKMEGGLFVATGRSKRDAATKLEELVKQVVGAQYVLHYRFPHPGSMFFRR